MKLQSITTLIVSVGIMLCGMVACGNTPWFAPGPETTRQLGTRLTHLLTNPKKVEMYSVVYSDSLRKGQMAVEPHFATDSLLCRLDKGQTAVLDFILIADSANYSFDKSIVPMIPHRPAYAFVFQAKKEQAIVWYSPDDFTWGIRYDGRDLFFYNVNTPSLMNRFCSSVTAK